MDTIISEYYELMTKTVTNQQTIFNIIIESDFKQLLEKDYLLESDIEYINESRLSNIVENIKQFLKIMKKKFIDLINMIIDKLMKSISSLNKKPKDAKNTSNNLKTELIVSYRKHNVDSIISELEDILNSVNQSSTDNSIIDEMLNIDNNNLNEINKFKNKYLSSPEDFCRYFLDRYNIKIKPSKNIKSSMLHYFFENEISKVKYSDIEDDVTKMPEEADKLKNIMKDIKINIEKQYNNLMDNVERYTKEAIKNPEKNNAVSVSTKYELIFNIISELNKLQMSLIVASTTILDVEIKQLTVAKNATIH